MKEEFSKEIEILKHTLEEIDVYLKSLAQLEKSKKRLPSGNNQAEDKILRLKK